MLIKHVLNCGNLYIYATVVQEVYNLDHSLEIQDAEDLAAVATRHLDYSNKGIRQKAVDCGKDSCETAWKAGMLTNSTLFTYCRIL